MSNPTYRKKLIEVALPLEAINRESAREKSIRHGHPSTLHLWWARRPLAACRAVLFAQLVDDPSSHPDKFPTEEAQRKERERLFKIIEEMVKWENINNERVLHAAREEILKSTDGNPPPVLDPFCGGGSIPLEAQRLGLKAYASDLNPVAVLITKAMIEIPPKFAGMPPVHPGAQRSIQWQGAKGLAEDVRYYGKWMRDEAEKRIGHLYPKAKLPKEYDGGETNVIAWIWARTVKCPNPPCGAQMPLVHSFVLSSKRGKQAWVEPVLEGNHYRFGIRTGHGKPRAGTVDRRGAICLCCGAPVPLNHVRSEGRAGRIGQRLMAIVADGPREKIYVSPNDDHEMAANKAIFKDVPDTDLPENALGFRVQLYGMTKHQDLFTNRQLVALTTFISLLKKLRKQIENDALKAGLSGNEKSLREGGNGAAAYSDAIATYLAFAVDRTASLNSALCWWNTGGFIAQTFARPTLSMVWDFAECNCLGQSTGSWDGAVDWVVRVVEDLPAYSDLKGIARQFDAKSDIKWLKDSIVSTDPPYYDNIGYADLSDFFYIWLRSLLKDVYPELFGTLLTPKAEELVAAPHRFGNNKKRAEQFFETGLEKAFVNMREVQHTGYPIAIYYAFKQEELVANEKGTGHQDYSVTSTGWETMLTGLLKSNFCITGTWPIRTERSARPRGHSSNALASSIVLVCRRRPDDASITTRRDFINVLKLELPLALKTLQQGNIAPVDLAQSAIGPGMAVFSRYSKVLEANGASMRVRSALSLINQVLDEYLTEQEGEYDADTRWALAWFEQHGMQEGPYGVAETLSKAKNTAIDGLMTAGVLISKAGKVRLLSRDELPEDWDPAADKRITVWEVTQHLIRGLVDKGSEEAAADLLRKVGALGDVARELAYRLYTICDRKKWAQEALAYNSLVVAWPELVKLAGQKEVSGPSQQELFQG